MDSEIELKKIMSKFSIFNLLIIFVCSNASTNIFAQNISNLSDTISYNNKVEADEPDIPDQKYSEKITYQFGLSAIPEYLDNGRTLHINDNHYVKMSKTRGWGSRVALTAIFPINEDLSLVSGLDCSGIEYSSRIYYKNERNVTRFLSRVYEYFNLNIPIEVRYGLNKWFYINAGLGANFYFDITNDFYRRKDNSDFIQPSKKTIELEKSYYKALDDRIRFMALSYRVSALIKTNRFGLESGYEHLLTNILKPHKIGNDSKEGVIRYGGFFVKLSYFFKLRFNNIPKILE